MKYDLYSLHTMPLFYENYLLDSKHNIPLTNNDYSTNKFTTFD